MKIETETARRRLSPLRRLSRLWRPDPQVYFTAYDGPIRRFDVRDAGGRRAHRELKREKRRRRVAELKARRARG